MYKRGRKIGRQTNGQIGGKIDQTEKTAQIDYMVRQISWIRKGKEKNRTKENRTNRQIAGLLARQIRRQKDKQIDRYIDK